MIRFAEGNLLDAKVDALVNTVNTVGVMGKGIALMFKDAYPENFRAYAAACKAGEVEVGRMFVTARDDLVDGPRWIVNFPTKNHWRHPSRIEWIEAGLADLVAFVTRHGVRSIALPPLGSGNGGLEWQAVRPLIEAAFQSIPEVDAVVFEPTREYQNVAKRSGVETLTAPRALVAEMVRRYGIMGIDCSLLEIQKLAYFAERARERSGAALSLDFRFEARQYGPYSEGLKHLLDGLDGSYLHCEKRIADAERLDAVWFDDDRRDRLAAYLASAGKAVRPVLDAASAIVDGFESPLGLELLATIDWLIARQGIAPAVPELMVGIAAWPSGPSAARRKARLFDERLVGIALQRLSAVGLVAGGAAA